MHSFGLGLRKEHFAYLSTRPKTQVDWFEVVTENYLDTLGPPLKMLEKIRQDYPVAFHGVSLSLANPTLDLSGYLKKLAALKERLDPFLISDHLCTTGASSGNLHNLLPFVYDEAHLQMVSERVDYVQNFLGTPILVENLSAYFAYAESTMSEWEFLVELCRKSGCKLLLDLNNVYVNSHNFAFDPALFLRHIPHHLVGQIHLAGFSDRGDFYFDTHSSAVSQGVWDLYESFIEAGGEAPSMVEWDEDIPDFGRVEQEMLTAKAKWQELTEKRFMYV